MDPQEVESTEELTPDDSRHEWHAYRECGIWTVCDCDGDPLFKMPGWLASENRPQLRDAINFIVDQYGRGYTLGVTVGRDQKARELRQVIGVEH